MDFLGDICQGSIMPIQVWTDGACSGNPGRGGAGAIIRYPDNLAEEMSFFEKNSTNQRMEIKAVIIALSRISSIAQASKFIEIYTDSAYVCNCINQKWYVNWMNNGWKNSKKEPVANKDLWESLFEGIGNLEKDYSISFIKVKGHSGNTWNEKVDRLAVAASQGDITNAEYYNTML